MKSCDLPANITVYSYDPYTLEYTHDTVAIQSPLDPPGTYLMPAHTTTLVPVFVQDKITKFVDGAWILEDVSTPSLPSIEELLEQAKNIKLAEINRAQFEYQNANITVAAGTFKADTDAKNNFFRRSNGVSNIVYVQADEKTLVELDQTDIMQISNAMNQRDLKSMSKKSQYLLSLESARTKEEVEAIIINFHSE